MPAIVAAFVMERINVPCDVERPIAVAKKGKKSVGRKTARPWEMAENLIIENATLEKMPLGILALFDA
jgi:hypothetical protein